MTTVNSSRITHVCPKCGIEYIPSKSNQTYCSNVCRLSVIKEKNIAQSKEPGLLKTCFTCGIEKPLTEYHTQYTAKYGVANHCKQCKLDQYRTQTYGENQTTICEICGTEFRKENGKNHCSKRCKQSARTIRNGGTPKPDRHPKRYNPIIDGMRVCTTCEQAKSIDTGFYWFKGVPVGVCIPCRNTQMAATARKRRELPESKAIRQEERRKIAEKKGKYYAPIEARKQETAIKHIMNSGGFNARKNLKEFLDSSSDEEMICWYTALGKPWNNPRLTEAESYRMQYQLDPDFQIHERMRRQLKKAATNDGVSTLIWRALKQNGESPKVTEMLGYTIAELRTHIGRQFTKGMTWDKFMNGEIHIDHIHPKASFDLSDADQWQICWGLPNLRPMWAKDNLAKSAKILTLL